MKVKRKSKRDVHKCKYCSNLATIIRMIENDWTKKEYLCGSQKCESKSRTKYGLNCKLKIEQQEGS